MPHSQGLSNIPILNRIKSIPCIDTNLFKIHSNTALPKYLFPVGLPVNILKELLPSTILATWPANLNLLDLITLNILDKEYKLLISSFWSLLRSSFSFLLGSNIRLRFLFSNTLSLHASLNVIHHISQPYNTTGKLNVNLIYFNE